MRHFLITEGKAGADRGVVRARSRGEALDQLAPHERYHRDGTERLLYVREVYRPIPDDIPPGPEGRRIWEREEKRLLKERKASGEGCSCPDCAADLRPKHAGTPGPFRAGYEVVVESGLQAATTPPRYAVAYRCGHVHELLEAADRCLEQLGRKPKWAGAVIHFAGSGVRADDWTELGPPPGVEPLSSAELERLRLEAE